VPAPTGDAHACVRCPTFEGERNCSNRLCAVCAASNPAWRQGETDLRCALEGASCALSLPAGVASHSASNATTAIARALIAGTDAVNLLVRLRFISLVAGLPVRKTELTLPPPLAEMSRQIFTAQAGCKTYFTGSLVIFSSARSRAANAASAAFLLLSS